MQTEHSPFPPDETLAAYIDGRLDEETRKRVVEHMAECPECLDVVMGGREFATVSEEPAGRVVQWPRNLAISLAAAAAVAMAVFLTPIRDLWPRDDIRELAAVAPAERYSDGRISGFPYRPLARTTRGPRDDMMKNPKNWKFAVVAARIAEATTKHRDAKTLHAEGVAQFAMGNGAVADLEEAVRKDPQPDARLFNDLSAAYIAAGRYPEALDTAERAWRLAHTPEIAWNRAIAAERLRQSDAATYWREYLQLDSRSSWAADARYHLRDVGGASR
jgi:tetratricopeptide (TPR) repeat protein